MLCLGAEVVEAVAIDHPMKIVTATMTDDVLEQVKLEMGINCGGSSYPVVSGDDVRPADL